MIQVFKPTLSTAELASVAHSFDTGWIGRGPKVAEFEAAWAAHISTSPAHVVSVNSCTEGLFMAVKLLGIGPGDEVIIPTIHFVGAAQAVLSVGAKPVFCDVDGRTLNADWHNIKQATNGKTAAIILNHYGGVPCNELERIKDWCTFKGLWLIEDAANAPASTFGGQAIGTFGDIGVWSFDAMKILSCGDGGMMYIRDRELAGKARKQLYLGTSEGSGLSSDRPRWWEFEVEIEGARRAIMNDIAAGIGLEQLKKLRQFVKRRAILAYLYDETLALTYAADVSYLPTRDWDTDSFYFYWIQTSRRDELARYLRERQIYVTFRYWPLHLAYHTGDSLPNAEWAAQNTLLLPLHQGLSDEDVSYVCEKVREFYDG